MQDPAWAIFVRDGDIVLTIATGLTEEEAWENAAQKLEHERPQN